MAYCKIVATDGSDISDLTFDLDCTLNPDHDDGNAPAKYDITVGPSAPETGDLADGSNTIQIQDGDVVTIYIGDADGDGDIPITQMNISNITGENIRSFYFGVDFTYSTSAESLLVGTTLEEVDYDPYEYEDTATSSVYNWTGAFENCHVEYIAVSVPYGCICDRMLHGCTAMDITLLSSSGSEYGPAPSSAIQMFEGTINLTFPPRINFVNITDATRMFMNTEMIFSSFLNPIEMFNTAVDIDWTNAFTDSINIEEIPFAIAGNKHTEMFKGCSNLKCVKAINTTNSTDTTDMFLDAGQNIINGEPRSPSAVEQTAILAGSDWIASCDCPSKIFVEEEEVHRIYHGENQIKKAKIAE